MKHRSIYKELLSAAIKDFYIIVLIFAGFYFIDTELAFFISALTTAILLTRRVILDFNPGFVKGHHINYHKKELGVPKGVDIFDLSTVPSIDYLFKYIEVIRSILRPPLILIIRFSEIIEMKECELDILGEAILRIQKSGIVVMISDAGLNIQNQFRQHGIEKKVGKGKIFDNIKDALSKAKIIRGSNQNKACNTIF